MQPGHDRVGLKCVARRRNQAYCERPSNVCPREQDRRVTVPYGFTLFHAYISRAPRKWLDRTTNLKQFTRASRGGYFAPFEDPEFYADESRAFFRPYRARLRQFARHLAVLFQGRLLPAPR